MASPSTLDETAFHGVTLSRFAAVRAALAEPFVLRRVLAVEGLALPDWRAADIAWKKHMTRHQERLLPLYRVELAAAEDWLLRIVTPLHEDIEAWADFLCAFTLKPAEVLRHAQMSTNDVSRLLRFWAAQTARDSSLATRAEARMKRGFTTLPKIEPEPRKLRRSRGSVGTASPSGDSARSVGTASPSGDSARGVAMVSAFGDRRSGPSTSPSEPAFPPVSSSHPRPMEQPSFLAQSDAPPLSGQASSSLPLPSFMAAQAQAAALAASPIFSAPLAPSRPDATGTQDVSAFLSGDELPFDPSARPSLPEASPRSVRPPEKALALNMPHSNDATGTQDLSALLSKGELPFDKPASSADAAGTQDLSALLSKGELPFDKPASSPDVAGTQDVSALLEGRSLPFAPSRVPPSSLAAKVMAPVKEAPRVEPPSAGGTQDVSAFLEAAPLPFEKANPTPDAAGTQDVSAFLAAPSLPFGPLSSSAAPRNPPAPAPERPLDMPLRQYASLCVDIGNRPENAADTLARYRLTPESKRTIDKLYRDRFVADPALFGEFRRACDAYQTYLSKQPSPVRAAAAGGRSHDAARPLAAHSASSPSAAHSASSSSAAHSASSPSASAWPSPHSASPSSPVSIPQLTIDQYAAVLVDLQLAPAHRAAVLQRHRLTEPLIAALDAAWSRYLATDPAARAAFQRATDAYRAWRARGAGG